MWDAIELHNFVRINSKMSPLVDSGVKGLFQMKSMVVFFVCK